MRVTYEAARDGRDVTMRGVIQGYVLVNSFDAAIVLNEDNRIVCVMVGRLKPYRTSEFEIQWSKS